jgi:hypothetical protein
LDRPGLCTADGLGGEIASDAFTLLDDGLAWRHTSLDEAIHNPPTGWRQSPMAWPRLCARQLHRTTATVAARRQRGHEVLSLASVEDDRAIRTVSAVRKQIDAATPCSMLSGRWPGSGRTRLTERERVDLPLDPGLAYELVIDAVIHPRDLRVELIRRVALARHKNPDRGHLTPQTGGTPWRTSEESVERCYVGAIMS